MPYLGRRAIENKSVLGEGQAREERRRVGREICNSSSSRGWVIEHNCYGFEWVKWGSVEGDRIGLGGARLGRAGG